MAAPTLELTDGTDTISLISANGHRGYHLDSDGWNPAIPDYKRGGVWQNSPLATGQRIVDRRFDNAVETFLLTADGSEQDTLITSLQDLRRMAEKATNYWVTSWQNEIVWIKAQSSCETNARYAVIKRARLAPDDNPYEQPFFSGMQTAVMDNLTLVVERGEWTENEPETGTAVQTYNSMTYDGRSHGRAATTTDEVFVANKLCEANLTDIYVDDGGAFGANLLDAALPYNLLPAVPVADDAVYFGIDTTLGDSGPFSSLVFDIGTAIAGVTGLVWEYYTTGAAWATLTVQDNTNAAGAMTGVAFDTTGVNSVHWVSSTLWATVAINGVTAYWVRARVTAAAGATAPTQQNRDPYAAMLPYVDIDSAQVPGDTPALSRVLAHNRSGFASVTTLRTNRLVYGVRSLDRGSSFAGYINIADDQLPTGVSISWTAGDFSYVDDMNSPTGRAVEVDLAGGVLPPVIDVIFSNAVAHEYYGTYHAYIRGQQTGGSADSMWAQLWVVQGSNQDILSASQTVYVADTNEYQVLDMGRIKIGVDTLSIQDIFQDGELRLRMYWGGSTATDVFNIYDLILIPVDEYSTDVLGDVNSELVEYDEYIDVDAITYLKARLRGLVRDDSSDEVESIYRVVSASPSVLQPNADQRIWFLTSQQVSATREDFDPAMSYSIRVQRQARYLSMRGDR